MGGSTFRERVLTPGPLRDAGPVVAIVRFWAQGWRLHGRASRTEFLWPLLFEAVVVVLVVGLPVWQGVPWRWDAYADPLGVVPSPGVQFRLIGDRSSWWGFGNGSNVTVTPNPWDLVVLAGVLLTAIPRWTLLVRRLHDRDHTGLWVLLLVFTGPINWLVVSGMALSRPRERGVRFDRTVWQAYRPSSSLPPV